MAVAAANSGKLRRPLSTLHEIKEKGITEVRKDKGKNMGQVRELGEFGTRRKWRKTAADVVAPARNFSGLRARFDEGLEGNGGGDSGAYIGQQMERDQRVNGWKSGRGFLPVADARISLEEEESVMSLLTSRWDPHVSLCGGKKRAGDAAGSSRAGCARLVLGWPR